MPLQLLPFELDAAALQQVLVEYRRIRGDDQHAGVPSRISQLVLGNQVAARGATPTIAGSAGCAP